MTPRPKLPTEVSKHLADLSVALAKVANGEPADNEVGAAIEAAVMAARRVRDDAAKLPETSRSYAEVVGQNLRKLRGDAQWTQLRLAEAMKSLGFPFERITIAQLEGGDRRASYEEAIALAALFGVPAIQLLLPPDGVEVILRGERYLDREAVIQLLLGDGGTVGSGGRKWRAPSSLWNFAPIDRPADDLWAYRGEK